MNYVDMIHEVDCTLQVECEILLFFLRGVVSQLFSSIFAG